MIRIVIPYYENPGQLVRQIEAWNGYSDSMREAFQVVLVDDGSPRNPALPVVEANPCRLKLGLWRVVPNIPWNQHGARNLGAKVAGEGWLLMTDVDHLLMPDQAARLLNRVLDPKRHYTFARVSLPDRAPYKMHCNSFLVQRSAYWSVGGYDEDFCGSYGGDGPFLRQLQAIARPEHLKDIHLVRVPREVQPDASTTEWERTGPMKDRYRALHEEKRRKGDEKATKPLRFAWERQL